MLSWHNSSLITIARFIYSVILWWRTASAGLSRSHHTNYGLSILASNWPNNGWLEYYISRNNNKLDGGSTNSRVGANIYDPSTTSLGALSLAGYPHCMHWVSPTVLSLALTMSRVKSSGLDRVRTHRRRRRPPVLAEVMITIKKPTPREPFQVSQQGSTICIRREIDIARVASRVANSSASSITAAS